MKGKIQSLLQNCPKGAVATAIWLEQQGISAQLCQKYIKGGWLNSMGYGAYSKLSENPTVLGGLYALQTQLNLPLHVGGVSALELRGQVHFVPMQLEQRPVYLFSNSTEDHVALPKWFLNSYPNCKKFDRRLFTDGTGVENFELENFSIEVSSTERALFEVLSLVPKFITFEHASLLFQGKSLLRSALVQSLLENCRSHVLKRLFLYFAKSHNLELIERLDLKKVDLGKGRRVIANGRYYCTEYNLMLPELIEDQDLPI